MSSDKATATHLRSERKARQRFLLLYLLMVILLTGLVAYFYHRSQVELMFSQQRVHLMQYASEQARKLKQLHRQFPTNNRYPRDSRFESAIYDLELQKIFSTLKEPYIDLDQSIYYSGESIHLVRMLDDYYLGAKFLVIEVAKDKEWQTALMRNIILYGGMSLILFGLLGFYLARQFVQPMRESILLLDRFIKDTTHELNTPLSAMLANIETIDRDDIGLANQKRLSRIEIAARTVSVLYDDLKFLMLERTKPQHEEELHLEYLIANRVEYFDVLMRSKGITLDADLSPATIRADKRMITRLIDNLLSNAIKYNRRNGTIAITLIPGELRVKDGGIGIDPEDLPHVFDRYTRFNKSEGGFGVGLNIVRSIAIQYGIDISLNSEPHQGTEVILQW